MARRTLPILKQLCSRSSSSSSSHTPHHSLLGTVTLITGDGIGPLGHGSNARPNLLRALRCPWRHEERAFGGDRVDPQEQDLLERAAQDSNRWWCEFAQRSAEERARSLCFP
ncbi:hypothetical protein CsSME_00009040 [Camellia sinensis var. sinensis]